MVTRTDTSPTDHKPECPYRPWYNQTVRWQPNHVLSEVVRSIMVEQLCTCKKDLQ